MWVSTSSDLQNEAQNDFKDIGASGVLVRGSLACKVLPCLDRLEMSWPRFLRLIVTVPHSGPECLTIGQGQWSFGDICGVLPVPYRDCDVSDLLDAYIVEGKEFLFVFSS